MGWDDLLAKVKPPVEQYRPTMTGVMEAECLRERAGDNPYGGMGEGYSPETYDKIWKLERAFDNERYDGSSNRKMRGF